MADSSDTPATDDTLPRSPQEDRRRAYLDTVFRAHYTSLYHVACSCGTRDAHDAQDIIQTVFQRLLTVRVHYVDAVLSAADPAPPAEHLLAYVYSSVRWRMSNRYHQDAQRAEHLAWAVEALRPTPLSRPDEAFEAAELAGHLRRGFALLSPQEWRVFQCIQLKGMTHAATAARLKISPSTVQSLYARALRKLVVALQPHLPDGWTLTPPRRRPPRRPPRATPPSSPPAHEPGVSR